MDLADVIAIYAALVSTGTALFAVYSWRRSPSSVVEIKEGPGDVLGPLGMQWSVNSQQLAVLFRISCIAVNRSRHPVVITDAHVWTRGRVVAVESQDQETNRAQIRSVPPRDFGTVALAPPDGALPVTVPVGQGCELGGELAVSHDWDTLVDTPSRPDIAHEPLRRRLRLNLDVGIRVSTNDGRVFGGGHRMVTAELDGVMPGDRR
jgi:hypothetical protein